MAYVLVLLAVLAAFVWATPARAPVTHALGESARAIAIQAGELREPLLVQGRRIIGIVRQKAAALLREQLHSAIDETVK